MLPKIIPYNDGEELRKLLIKNELGSFFDSIRKYRISVFDSLERRHYKLTKERAIGVILKFEADQEESKIYYELLELLKQYVLPDTFVEQIDGDNTHETVSLSTREFEIKSVAAIIAYLSRVKELTLAEDKAFLLAIGQYIERCSKIDIKNGLIDESLKCVDALLYKHQRILRREVKRLLLDIKATCSYLIDQLDNNDFTTKDYQSALNLGQKFIDASVGLG